MKISVVIPSRTQPRQAEFLQRALRSIRNQTVVGRVEIEILIGLDAGERPPASLVGEDGVVFVEGYAKSQVAALNSAFAAADGDIIAMLEDDDRWLPNYLSLMLELSRHAPFVTTNEVEVDEESRPILLSDFATPSAWVMRREAWTQVGRFSDEYRYHFDCDWLGRAREAQLPRIHVVEAEAPIEAGAIEQRPMLALIARQGGAAVRLANHEWPGPLVVRMRHTGAGLAIIAREAEAAARSRAEHDRLRQRYGVQPC